MTRQRATGMRIPTGPRPTRSKVEKRFHTVVVAGPWLTCVAFIAAGEPWGVIPFALVGIAYLAADVHS